MKQFSQEIINAVHWANKQFPTGRVVFCGSFGLVLNGLLDREIKDIDLLTEESYYGVDLGDVVNEIRGESGYFWIPTENKNRQIKVKCFKIYSPFGVTIDVLNRIEKEFNVEYEEVDFYGEKILVETPQGAITAKKRYLQSDQLQYRDKHIADLEEIENNMMRTAVRIEVNLITDYDKNTSDLEDWEYYKDNMIE